MSWNNIIPARILAEAVLKAALMAECEALEPLHGEEYAQLHWERNKESWWQKRYKEAPEKREVIDEADNE